MIKNKKIIVALLVFCALLFLAGCKRKSAEGFEYIVLEDGTASIVGYNEEDDFDGNLVIPSAIGSHEVSTIGDYAFADTKEIKKVSFEDGTVKIGAHAFRGCSEITSIEFPDTLVEIGDYAFLNCFGFTNITFPDSLETIGLRSFQNCTSLVGLTFGSGLETIGRYAFYCCNKLTGISLQEGLTTIDDEAFSNCLALTTVNLPSSLTTLGAGIFNACKKINVTLYDNAYYLGTPTNPYFLLMYKKDATIQTCNIHADTKYISSSAFSDCSQLYSVNIPEGLLGIGANAFNVCPKLTTFVIPNGVKKINDYTFYGCSGLVSISIGTGVESIGAYAFYGCEDLSYGSFPANLKSIGNMAFSGCKNLGVIFYGDTEEKYEEITVGINNTELAAVLFVNERDGVTFTNVSDEDWQYVLTNSNEIIGLYCKTKTIESVDFETLFEGYKIFSFEEGAFRSCNKIKTINIPDGIVSIAPEMFKSCLNLVAISLPSSVTAVKDGAFDGCTKLQVVFTEATQAEYTSEVVVSSNNTPYTNSTIKYDRNDVEFTSYSDETWNYVLTNSNEIIALVCSSNELTECNFDVLFSGKEILTLGAQAFNGCKKLTSIIIPNGITGIGDSAFSGCTALATVTIPDSVISIEGNAFYNCTSLTSITLNKVKTIGDYAFNTCTSLTTVYIGNDVTSIGGQAFGNCSNLETFSVGSNLTKLGANAFSGCDKLTYFVSNGASYLGNSDNHYVILVSIEDIESASYIVEDVNIISAGVFKDSAALKTIYFKGAQSDYTSISTGLNNGSLSTAKVYYYSYSEPTETTGSYWHFDENDQVVIWGA